MNMTNKEIVEGYKFLVYEISKNKNQRIRLNSKATYADSWEEKSKYLDEVYELEMEHEKLFNTYLKLGKVNFRLNLADLLERTLENNKNLKNIDVSIKYTSNSKNVIEELYKNGGIEVNTDIIISSKDFYVPLYMNHAYLRYSSNQTNNDINSKIKLNILGDKSKIPFPIRLHDIDIELDVSQIFSLNVRVPRFTEFAGVNCECFINAALDIICEEKDNVKRLKK